MRFSLLIPVLTCLTVAAAGADEPLEEYQALSKVLKAFMGLVAWPGSLDRPLRLAVIGGNGFGTDLDIVMSRGTVGGRRVEIRYLSGADYLATSQEFDAVFIDRGQEGNLPAILQRLKGRPVLTMGYAPGLAQKGVMVNFVLESTRMTFEVNPLRAREAGLVVSSRLLSLARIVEG